MPYYIGDSAIRGLEDFDPADLARLQRRARIDGKDPNSLYDIVTLALEMGIGGGGAAALPPPAGVPPAGAATKVARGEGPGLGQGIDDDPRARSGEEMGLGQPAYEGLFSNDQSLFQQDILDDLASMRPPDQGPMEGFQGSWGVDRFGSGTEEDPYKIPSQSVTAKRDDTSDPLWFPPVASVSGDAGFAEFFDRNDPYDPTLGDIPGGGDFDPVSGLEFNPATTGFVPPGGPGIQPPPPGDTGIQLPESFAASIPVPTSIPASIL